jgi:hypothetical protein
VGGLLNCEQAASPLHQVADAPMQHEALVAIKLAVAIRMHLSRYMKTGLLNTGQQAVSKHLEIKG